MVPSGVKKAAGTRVATCLLIPEEFRDLTEWSGVGAKQREVLELVRRSAEPLTVADVSRMAKCGIGPIAALRK